MDKVIMTLEARLEVLNEEIRSTEQAVEILKKSQESERKKEADFKDLKAPPEVLDEESVYDAQAAHVAAQARHELDTNRCR